MLRRPSAVLQWPCRDRLDASSHAAAPPLAMPLQATHIFDGLESWPSHVMYVAGGCLQVRQWGAL